jgi:hypothetical protein
MIQVTKPGKQGPGFETWGERKVVKLLLYRLRSLVRLAPTAELGAVISDIGRAARELVLASCDCATAMQESLLRSSSLCAPPLTHESIFLKILHAMLTRRIQRRKHRFLLSTHS